MTEVDKEFLFHESVKEKSSRSLYHEACQELGILFNKKLLWELSAKAGEYLLRELVVDGDQYLGERGAFALTNVLHANRVIGRVVFREQGMTDDNVTAMLPVLRVMERLEELNLQGNKDITDDSVAPLLEVMGNNRMLCNLRLEGTGVSSASLRKVQATNERNASVEADFFHGDVIYLKKVFLKLDVDKSGSIGMDELVAEASHPKVRAALEKRFEAIDATTAGSRYNSCMDVNEFIYFMNPKFWRMADIDRFSQTNDPGEYATIANWKALQASFAQMRLQFNGWHNIRIRSAVLNAEQAAQFAAVALEEHWKVGDAAQSTTASGMVPLSSLAVKQAVERLYGEQERQRREEERAKWGSSLTPTFVRAMYEVFLQHIHGNNEAIRNSGWLPQAPVQALVETPVKTTSQIMKPRMLASVLESRGLPIQSIGFTFPEWFAVINDRADTCILNYYGSPWRSELESVESITANGQGSQQFA